MAQTTIQKTNSIRFGSGQFEIKESGGSWIDLGAMRGIAFAEEWEQTEVTSDNTDPVVVRIFNHVCSMTGDLMEIDLSNLAAIRGGLDTFSTVTGSTVAGTEDIIDEGDWSADSVIMLGTQSSSGQTAAVVNSVTGTVAGLMTEDTDYFVVSDVNGNVMVSMDIGSPANNVAQDLTINYDYTTADSVSLSTGGVFEISPIEVKITNFNSAGEKFEITVYSAKNQNGISIELQSDESGEAWVSNLVIQGRIDSARTAGDQLFKIVDEQNA